MAIFFAAGNSGADGTPSPPFGICANGNGVVDPDSLNSPGTAKNVITVGATESDRADGGLASAPWLLINLCFATDPVSTDTVADDPNGMAAFSSRGPTDDGRTKPDLVAPGTNIVSNRSHYPGATTLWSAHETNDHYVYSGGTSMSTPLVAGSAVLVRQWLQSQGLADPSAAMLKAVLLNTTVDIAPGQYGAGSTQEVPYARPNSVAGWGRANLDFINAAMPYHLWLDDHAAGLNTGDTITYTDSAAQPLRVLSDTLPLRVMLAWTDPPASLSAATQLVNDLDLRVTAPGGGVYYGNGGASADRTNNVEGVIITAPTPGLYTITIQGFNVPTATQPYALAVSGALITETAVIPPTAGFTSSSPDTLGEPTHFVNTTAGAAPLYSRWNFGDGTTSTLTAPTHTYTRTGTYTVTLSVTNTAGSDVATDTVVIELSPPAAGFTSSGPDLLGETTRFTNTTAGPVDSYQWDFGDSSAPSNLENPTHAYAATGTYTVTLTATNAAGSDVATDTVAIRGPAPVAGFTTSSPDWLSETTRFTNTTTGAAPIQYRWDFGDGVTGAVATPTHTYTQTGSYTVTLTATNANGNDVATRAVVIALPAPTAGFISSSPDRLGETTIFANTTSGPWPSTYQWDFGDGSALSTMENPTHTYAAVGIYTVTLTAANAVSSDAVTGTVVIAPEDCVAASGADFTYTPLTPTLGIAQPGVPVTFTGAARGTPPINYAWAFGDNQTGNGAAINHTYTLTGAYTVVMTAANLCGTDTASTLLTVWPATEVQQRVYLPVVIRQ